MKIIDVIVRSSLAVSLSVAVACVQQDDQPAPEVGTSFQGLNAQLAHGRDVWFKNTYGGEKFFTFLANHPDPSQRIKIGFEAVVNTPRAVRFDVWGVINDPDCTADPAGGPDICADPNATGIIGIRKFPGPGGSTMYGAACASCHAGFDPIHPPADPNEPTWANIHPSIGNQYLKFSALFAANLDPTDVRGLMFAAWPDGAVDTTALFSDNIMNPGVVTAFWEHDDRNKFDVGMDQPQLRNGQGGEDDVGGQLAALRVYTNIGVCFAECTAPAAATGTELDVDACRQNCADFPPDQDMDDLVAFLDSIEAPKYPERPRHLFLYWIGRWAFQKDCVSCHDNTGDLRSVLSNDEVNPLVADPANATNACRALTTNWEAGKLWGQFSSDVYKARAAAGNKGYRTMPLGGIWATEPFMHNQSIGEWAPADASVHERRDAYFASMQDLLSTERAPKINTLPFAVGPFPAGTPLAYLFSRDPATGQLLCDDVVENHGHYFGSELPGFMKFALSYWLLFQ